MLMMEVTAALWLKFQKPVQMLLEMEEVKLLTKFGFFFGGGGEHAYCPIVVYICLLFNKGWHKLEGSSLAKLFQCVRGLC